MFVFFKQMTAYEMRISDWSSYVCSSDLVFSQRRKAIRNGVKSWLTSEQIEAAGVNPGCRPDDLSVADFVALANSASRIANNSVVSNNNVSNNNVSNNNAANK